MNIVDAELAQAIEQSTARYDKVRSLAIIHQLGVDAVREAIEEDEIENQLFVTLSPEEQRSYDFNLAQQLIANEESPDYEPAPHERYIDAEVDFDDHARTLLGQVSDGYWFGTIERNHITLRTVGYTEATRIGELSMMLLRAQATGDSIRLVKEKRFGGDKQTLQVTDHDKAIMQQAAMRLGLIAAIIEENS